MLGDITPRMQSGMLLFVVDLTACTAQLSLGMNYIGDSGAEVLAKALAVNRTITGVCYAWTCSRSVTGFRVGGRGGGHGGSTKWLWWARAGVCS